MSSREAAAFERNSTQGQPHGAPKGCPGAAVPQISPAPVVANAPTGPTLADKDLPEALQRGTRPSRANAGAFLRKL